MNTAKYFALLENLSFNYAAGNTKPQENSTHVLSENLKQLEKFVKIEIGQQLNELCKDLGLFEEYAITIDTDSGVNSYIVRLLHVLHTLTQNINFHSDAKEDLICVAHLKLCIQTVQELSYYALRSQLHEDFYRSPVYKDVQSRPICPPLLLLSIQFFARFLAVRQFHIANAMELVQRDLLAAIVSLRSLGQNSTLDAALTYLWEQESKADFFRHVLLLKATPKLCAPLSQELHRQLLGKLSAAHGFASLVAALQAASPELDSTRSSEIVANIVAQRSFSPRLQQRLIAQIIDFCRLQLPHPNALSSAVLSLRRLYELNATNREQIDQLLADYWQPLTEPEDLLNGLIIWERAELCVHLRLWQQLFCNSSVACLPSSLLVPYLPLLLQLYKQLPKESAEQQMLTDLITRCLNNREPQEELPQVLQQLYSWPAQTDTWKCLHPRISIDSTVFNVRVTSLKEEEQQPTPGRVLIPLLMSSSNYALTSKSFLALLSLMLATPPSRSGTDLLSTQSELADFLQSRYQLQLELLQALEQLVWHAPLKTQLAESSSKEFVQLVTKLLEQRLNWNLQTPGAEQVDQMLLIMLLLLLEILERNGQAENESTRRLKGPLKQLMSKPWVNPLVKSAAEPVLAVLGGGTTSTDSNDAGFQRARELLEQRQPHLQVYGIQLMLEALRRKDATFTSQGHRILALALSTLKSQESYTFLNCVRLFVELVHHMESEVLELLSAEYLSETQALDYRLVVGEAVLKAAQELGALCYRYKNVLLNCFVHGSRSPLNEFRSSALANLAQLCRLLSYQVPSYFQELLQLIDQELSHGSYLPAKRAALLVLAELLAGMDNLMDYQELLLPIYRLLCVIEANEDCDPQMRLHAANGLKTLNEKCRQLLNSASTEQVQREIKVLGIKDTASPKKQRHILELN